MSVDSLEESMLLSLLTLVSSGLCSVLFCWQGNLTTARETSKLAGKQRLVVCTPHSDTISQATATAE